jgi:cytochrome P450
MLHDETDFPDPEEFIPERYLEQTASGWKYVPTKIDPRVVNFGYGRRYVFCCQASLTRVLTIQTHRVCPGRELALLSMFNTIAVTLHLFNITTQKGHSHPMREHEYEDAFLS